MLIVKETELKRYIELINNIKHTVIVFTTGEVWWTLNDKRHREDDKPAVITSLGDRFWYKNNTLHRENDNPAVIYGRLNTEEWWINGKRHRENGQPSIIDYRDNELSYYIHNTETTKEKSLKYSLKNKLDQF
jgi:hypothetical protein